jgi:MSHA biogenesis protein MshJ
VKLWRKTASYIDSRPLRERWLILGTAFAVLVLVIDLLALQPLLDDRTQLGRDMRTVEADIRTQNEEIARLQLELAKNPNEAPRRELAQLEQEMALLERRIAEVTRRLVAPDQMASVLQAVLSRAGRLQLLSLENLEPQPLEITHPDRDEQQPRHDRGLHHQCRRGVARCVIPVDCCCCPCYSQRRSWPPRQNHRPPRSPRPPSC